MTEKHFNFLLKHVDTAKDKAQSIFGSNLKK